MGLGNGCKMLKKRRIPFFLLGNCKMGDERLRFKRKMSCGCYLWAAGEAVALGLTFLL